MSIASAYNERYNKLPSEWIRTMDIWGGDCVEPVTCHYGDAFYAFLSDIKKKASVVKYDEEYSLYNFTFSDGSSATLDNCNDTFQTYN